MAQQRSNLVLIGMPGSGKSTVGVILAKRTSRGFLDTDLLIQASERRPLQDIVDSEGYLELRRIEEEVLLQVSVTNHVIATGGSAVYSDRAMAHLKADGIAVFLDLDLATLEARVLDLKTRGIAKRPGQSFSELYDERCVLYRQYADVVVKCHGLTQEQVCERILDQLGGQLLIP